MRTRNMLFALLSLTPACFDVHVSANVDVDQDVAFELGDIGTTCDGTGRSESDSGVATWTKTAVGDRCRIDIDWTGTLMDMAEVDGKAKEQAGDVKLTLKSVHMAFDDAALLDDQANDITPPRVPAWEAHIRIADQPLADFAGTDVSQLLAGPITFDMNEAQIAVANQALASAGRLEGTGTAMLLVEMADVAALGAAKGPHIELHFVANVTADAAKDLL